jgi:hypothetical protein
VPVDSGPPAGNVFASPQAAMLAVAAAAEGADFDRIKAIFWRYCADLVEPGGEDAYENDCLNVAGMIREGLAFDESAGGHAVALVGKNHWRFPVPLVRGEQGWTFDLAEGEEEILTREIGRNELLTIESLEEYADAQREYAAEGHDGDARAWARRFESTDGRRDGLHWRTRDVEKPSPIGPLLAAAAAESPNGATAAFNGYRYRMLHDGCRRPSPAESRPTTGCAAIAWPAAYGITGITTFIVDQAGIVFEKDLGPETEQRAGLIVGFAPAPDWKPSRGAPPAN